MRDKTVAFCFSLIVWVAVLGLIYATLVFPVVGWAIISIASAALVYLIVGALK